jgi:hypothetical protein
MDAGNGFAEPAWQAGYPALVAKERANGIALLAIRSSRHFAALWPDVEPLARDGLVALALVNSMACVVPSGGTRALFGTNPIAFAAPRAGHDRWCSTWRPAHRPWRRADRRAPCLRRALRNPGARHGRSGPDPPAG